MPVDPALLIFPNEYVPHAQASSYHPRWVKANPGENAKWERYRDDVIAGKQVVPPVLATEYGQALIAAGKEHMSITHFVGTPTNPNPPPPQPSPPPPPPPPVGTIYHSASLESGNIFDYFASIHYPSEDGTQGTPHPERISIVTAEVEGGVLVSPREGTRMLRSEVRPGEIWYAGSGTNVASAQAAWDQLLNDDWYYGLAFYLGSTFVQTANTATPNIWEVHGESAQIQAPFHLNCQYNPGVGNNLDANLSINPDQQYSPVVEVVPGTISAAKGTWMNCVMRLYQRRDATGRFQYWQRPSGTGPMTNADLKADYTGVSMGASNANYFIVGLYRANSGSSATIITYFDAIRVGSTLEIVDPGNYS